MALAPGTKVGRFTVSRRVATGGMGEVWEGVHATTGIRVALKTLLPDCAKSREVVLRFNREAELLAHVRSDRVARVVDFLVDPAFGPVLITEFIEGRSLADVMDSERLGIQEVVALGIDIARAVRELHRARIVHRDLKPGNVILQPAEGGGTRAVLVDLGVSRLIASGSGDDDLTALTKTQIVVGTLGYMPPEQILSSRDVTEAADVYALGAMLFRMVAGHPVFGQLSGVDLMRTKLLSRAPRVYTGRTDRLARGFQHVVSRALERDLQARYPSIDAMLDDLMQLQPLVDRVRDNGATVRRVVLAASVAAASLVAVTLTTAAVVRLVARAGAPDLTAQVQHLGRDGASAAVVAEALGPGVPLAQGSLLCLPTDAKEGEASPASADSGPAPFVSAAARAKASQRARDAYLMRAIRDAVEREAYRTVSVPSGG
jgi:serine/threonine-protein kinase